MPDPSKSAQWNRGAYLVNGPGHCAECHSPRNVLGGIIDSERFAGGPAPDGKGWVPNITPLGLRDGDKVWSEKDIASFLGDGMMPYGDYAGGRDGRRHPQYVVARRRRSRRDRKLHRFAAADGRAHQAAEERKEKD